MFLGNSMTTVRVWNKLNHFENALLTSQAGLIIHDKSLRILKMSDAGRLSNNQTAP